MAQKILILVKTGIFYEFSIFKVAENRDSKTHFRAAEIAEKEWVECSS